MARWFAAVLALLIGAAPAVAQEIEISVYTGFQSAPHSRVSGDDPGGIGAYSFVTGWEGRSFEAPPHYGIRATWWWDQRQGLGIELNHTKVYAEDGAANGFSRLEFSDGLNIVTLNYMRRWGDETRRWTPYAGVGVGVAIPHVDAETVGSRTFEYQFTGPAAAWMAGISYDLTERWGVFGEYKGTYSSNRADLDGGGSLNTDVVTNALNFGVSYRF